MSVPPLVEWALTRPYPSARIETPLPVSRALPDAGPLLFYLDADHRLQGACGWGPGNSVAKDVKLCERLISARIALNPASLADPHVSLKHLLRG